MLLLKTDYYLRSFYPTDFNLDKQNNNFLYQCDPILMDINDEYIRTSFKKITLTNFEKQRNIKSGLYTIGLDKENVKIEID